MLRHRGLALGAYLVGASLILLPLLDATLALSPVHFSQVRWRFGAAGLLSNALMVPNAGLLLLLVTAVANEHTTFRRILGAAAFVGATICVLMMGGFVLDALQSRSDVLPGMNTSFAAATILALTKMLVAATILIALGLVGIRTPRGVDTPTQRPAMLGVSPPTPGQST